MSTRLFKNPALLIAATVIGVVGASSAAAASEGGLNLAQPPAGVKITPDCKKKTLETASQVPTLIAEVCEVGIIDLGADAPRTWVSARLINASPSVPFFVDTVSVSDTAAVGQYVDHCVYKAWLFPGKEIRCSGNSAKFLPPAVVGRFTYYRQPDGTLQSAEFVF